MTDAPKPITGYLAAMSDWDPARVPTHIMNLLPATKAGLREARAQRDHALMFGSKWVVLKVETVYTLVEDVGDA